MENDNKYNFEKRRKKNPELQEISMFEDLTDNQKKILDRITINIQNFKKAVSAQSESRKIPINDILAKIEPCEFSEGKSDGLYGDHSWVLLAIDWLMKGMTLPIIMNVEVPRFNDILNHVEKCLDCLSRFIQPATKLEKTAANIGLVEKVTNRALQEIENILGHMPLDDKDIENIKKSVLEGERPDNDRKKKLH